MTDLQEAKAKVIEFLEQRGWNKTTSADLAKSIIIESAELLEHYQWDESKQNKSHAKDLTEIEAEVADIFWYLIVFCERNNINLLNALNKKLEHNKVKYPQDLFNGKHNDQAYKAQKKKYR